MLEQESMESCDFLLATLRSDPTGELKGNKAEIHIIGCAAVVSANTLCRLVDAFGF